MSRRRGAAFAAVRSVGGLLPDDFLQRLAVGDKRIEGSGADAYHLAKNERIGEIVNRSWTRLLGAWRAFRDAVEQLPEGDAAVSLTRERWLLPLFQELGYGRLVASKPVVVEDKTYPVSHVWQSCPIHLLGAGVVLDRRSAGVAGAAHTAPHGLVQSLLNRSHEHLWGFVSNGHVLRLLRDTHSLTRQAFLEFDLESIMEGELYSEFLALWLICHQSRVEPQEPGKPETCWLERWFQTSREEGVRALDRLRGGVEQAIQILGRGFLREDRKNDALHSWLSAEEQRKHDYYRELLRLVYRLIFLFVAEDRVSESGWPLLLDPSAPADAKERYVRFYSTKRIRDLADRRRGTAHGDLWRGLRLVMNQLEGGCPDLALPALDSFIWRPSAVEHLLDCELANEDLLAAVRRLCRVADAGIDRQVSFKDLGAEELGSIYEALLELQPRIHRESGLFELGVAAGHERKTTGSYYTPTSLVECLLDTALDPVLSEAAAKPDPQAALLDLKVCDPACGSGHFLVAAGRRIARRLAAIRTGDEEPSPEALRSALRDVIGRCLYGVDINPMAVELCKVSFWMEALEPGKPLSFLEGHIQCGNALLGTTPALMARGIPTEAFTELTGDDKEVLKRLRKRNREALKGQTSMVPLFVAERTAKDELPEQALQVEQAPDETIEQLREKEQSWASFVGSYAYRDALFRANLWCAAFLWPKEPGDLENGAPTQDLWLRVERDTAAAPQVTRATANKLAKDYALFHWHLAFPAVFRPPARPINDDTVTGWEGGFDVVLGNPPWERLKLQEKEFFAARDPEIANAPNASARKKRIDALRRDDPSLFVAWQEALRRADGESALVRQSGRYPLCGRGDINTYAIFAELNRTLMAATGRVGCILPSGIATDDTTKLFFGDLVSTRSLASLFHFENEEFVFPAVHHAYRFCLVTLTGSDRPVDQALFVGYARQVRDVYDEARRYKLGPDDFALMNPNTRTLPVFRWARDAEITKAIYRRVPVLVREDDPNGNPWGVTFMAMFHMANDSGLFRTHEWLEERGFRRVGNIFEKASERYLPLYEAKMVHHFDHRFGTYEGQTEAQARQGKLPETTPEQHADPDFVSLPRYWVAAREVEQRLGDPWDRGWLLGWRDVCRSSDARTLIGAVIPVAAVGDKYLLMLPGQEPVIGLSAALSSFITDYIARQKLGGTALKYFVIRQVAIPDPAAMIAAAPWSSASSVAEWLRPRVLELAYTAYDLAQFARDLGWTGPPFPWDEERRFLLRCELDAAFFHLYGVARDDVAHILDSFWVIKDRDERAHGRYRTKDTILDIYDRLQRAIDTKQPYATVLDPPPADPRVAHPPREAVAVPRVAASAVPGFAALADGVWAAPNGVTEANVALFSLVEVLRAASAAVDAGRVRLAALIVRKPALALPFLDARMKSEWMRVVGSEARPLPDNVISLSRFQKNAVDRAWADAVKQLKASGGLVEDLATETWSAGARLPASGQDWIEGRAAMAVRLLAEIDLAQAEQNLIAFVKDVEHAAAGQAVS